MVSVLLFVLPGIALGPLVLPDRVEPAVVGGSGGGRQSTGDAHRVHRAGHARAALGGVRRRCRRSRCRAARLRRAAAAPAVPGRPARRRRAWFAAAAIGHGLALAVIVVPSHLGVRPDLLPRSSTTWYYLHLAQAMADLGAFPATLAGVGCAPPVPDRLPAGDRAHGGRPAAAPRRPAGPPRDLPAADPGSRRPVRDASCSVAGSRAWTPWLGAILLLGTVRLDQKFDGYRPETVAFVARPVRAVGRRPGVRRARPTPRRRWPLVGAARGLPEPRRGLPDPGARRWSGSGSGATLVAPRGRGPRLGLRRPIGRALVAPRAGGRRSSSAALVLGAAGGWLLTGESARPRLRRRARRPRRPTRRPRAAGPARSPPAGRSPTTRPGTSTRPRSRPASTGRSRRTRSPIRCCCRARSC